MPLPIVLGVTGHRNIPQDALPILRERFCTILDTLKAEYPDTPLLVLSALAAGADVLAAEAALERGAAVIAVLPMPQEEYERDFTPGERDRFRTLLARCERQTVASDGRNREAAYAAAGTQIVYYSHLLVAFWDGGKGNGLGGTADMVDLRESGIPRIVKGQIIPYLPDIGPVYHIVTPREGMPLPEKCYETIERYPPRYDNDIQAMRDFRAALRNLDRYNRDIGAAPVTSLEELMHRTDDAANALQRRYLRSLNLMYGSAMLAGAVQIVDVGQGAVIRILILAIAFLFFRKAHREDYENRYQDYRAISEGLRVQNAWCGAGLQERMVDATYSRMQHSELQWIRMAIRTAYLVTDAGRPRAGAGRSHPDCVRWIDEQRTYYKKAAPREEQRLKKLERFSKVLMAVCIAITLGAIIAGLRSQAHPPSFAAHLPLPVVPWIVHHPNVSKFLQTGPAALAVMVALLLRFYGLQRGYAENARRYAHMYNVFDFAQKRLKGLDLSAAGEGDAETIVHELGREALTEHADWLVLHRERPFQFVTG